MKAIKITLNNNDLHLIELKLTKKGLSLAQIIHLNSEEEIAEHYKWEMETVCNKNFPFKEVKNLYEHDFEQRVFQDVCSIVEEAYLSGDITLEHYEQVAKTLNAN